MKLLARILSHGFAIAVVLLLAIGLIYRGKLFPEYDLPGFLDIGKLAEHREESTTAQVLHETAEAAAGVDSAEVETAAKTPEPAPAEPEVIPQEPAGIEPEAPSAMPEAPEEGSAADYPVPVPAENGQQHGTEPPETAPPLTEDSGPPAAADLTAPGSEPEYGYGSMDAANMVTESETAIPEATTPHSKPQVKAYQLLADAREAYWLRDYDIAESKYKDLTRMDPDNPDGYGELGNMYFSQGQWEEAASAYYEAGVRLIRQGLVDQAEELVAVIRGLNGGHADDLEQKIKEARSAAN